MFPFANTSTPLYAKAEQASIKRWLDYFEQLAGCR